MYAPDGEVPVLAQIANRTDVLIGGQCPPYPGNDQSSGEALPASLLQSAHATTINP
jgi:hypothetical protein